MVPDTTDTCENGGVLDTLPGLLGVTQATEIIKWITKSGVSLLNRLLCINGLNMEIKTIHLVKNEECSFCVYGQRLEARAFERCEVSVDLQSLTISAEGLLGFLQENPNVLLLDVRTLAEHAVNNLGGKVIPLPELPNRLNELDPLQKILIYCQSGQRSQRACNIMMQAGFRSIYHLATGIESLS